MNCPHDPTPEAPPPEVQAFTSPQETMSQVSGPSSTGKTSFSSPLKASDLGLPLTPEHRQSLDLDDAALEEGYDSDGLCPPQLGPQVPLVDERQADKEPLPFGPPAVSVEVPVGETVAGKILTVDEVKKMKIAELGEELKKRGLPV